LKVVKEELEDKDIQWLSERLEAINNQFKERTRFSLSSEKVDEPDYVDLNIDDIEDTVPEYHPGEESE
jgi:hypothetical protein